MHLTPTWRVVGIGALAVSVLTLPAFSTRAHAAGITSLVITRTESPTFGGTSFGSVGPYEKLIGLAAGEVDPADPRNAAIVDLDRSPRNARGMVEYSTSVVILKPVDPSRGNHRLLFDINNRGDLVALGQFNDAPDTNDPSTARDAGNGFLMRMGYTLVSSGWDISTPPGNNRLAMTVPIAINADLSPVVGLSLEEFVIDAPGPLERTLTYPALTMGKSQASMSVRAHYGDAPDALPPTAWEFVDDRHVRLLPPGAPFRPGSLYELTYVAEDSRVAGLAFAALRDLVEYLRFGDGDPGSRRSANLGDVQGVLSFSFSQPSRFMHDFVRSGFNADSRGRRAFDAVLSWAGGGSGGFFNYRFAQPARTHRQHIGRWYPERQFPFADAITFDPVTGRTDGRLAACRASNTCPRIFEVNSENEDRAKAGSLVHTDTVGHDLADPPDVRHFLLASLPHSRGRGPTGAGICELVQNPLVANATLRALLTDLDGWATRGVDPPASRVPRVADGTLVPPLPQSGVGFPSIPGITYNGRLHEGDAFDFGAVIPGILDIVPPRSLGTPYPALVPSVDRDGNDVAGIRQIEIAVPLATYTGWALRRGAASGDGCDASGQQIPFAATRAERLASGDPRLSIEERYPTADDYIAQVAAAARQLVTDRFLLDEDVDRANARARSTVLR